MLELKNVTSSITAKGNKINLLEDISLCFQPGQLIAIVGPSGCGKTSFIKTIAGMNDTSEGQIIWKGTDLEEKDFAPHELGYVPQFSSYAANLRISLPKDQVELHLEQVLKQTGLFELADKPVKVLSGGQKRRLSLAIELTANPEALLCDEVTSGLDLHSENEIVKLLKSLAVEQNRLVLSVTHSLENLKDYDAVVVLFAGRLCYHGPPDMILHYFRAENASGIYHQLPNMEPENWAEEWNKLSNRYTIPENDKSFQQEEEVNQTVTPNFFKQTSTLLSRRWKILFRDKTQVFITLALIIGFPLIVMLFSDQGRETIRQLSDTQDVIFRDAINKAERKADQLLVGSAVSGIIMFQIILLCLTGSNNSAREISGERQIWEKERLAGVSPASYLTSKILFLSVLVFIQSTVMAFLVELAWPFRGNFMLHWASLILINSAMTMICLAISSLLKNPAQSSLLSIYFVGFQLPLSGAILTLPNIPEKVSRSFISAYWSWSASIDALQGNIHSAVKAVSGTGISDMLPCFIVLIGHIIFGFIFTIIGINRSLSN